MRESHSEKGLKTISLMNTKPDDWGLTPIKWVKQKMMWPVEKECPACRGRGKCSTYADGRVFDHSKVTKALQKKLKVSYLGHFEMEAYKKKNGVDYRRCPKCPQKSARGFGPIDVGTGKIIVMEETEVTVGYPIWPKGCLFDSRFEDALYYTSRNSDKPVKHVCALCSKSITGRWSYTIPVNAKGADGKTHGMYVGEDCARKFLGLELVLDMEQLKEVKKSVRKQRVQIRITKESK